MIHLRRYSPYNAIIFYVHLAEEGHGRVAKHRKRDVDHLRERHTHQTQSTGNGSVIRLFGCQWMACPGDAVDVCRIW